MKLRLDVDAPPPSILLHNRTIPEVKVIVFAASEVAASSSSSSPVWPTSSNRTVVCRTFVPNSVFLSIDGIID